MRIKRIFLFLIIAFALTIALSGCVIITDNANFVVKNNSRDNYLYISDIYIREEHEIDWRHVYEQPDPIYGIENRSCQYISLEPGSYWVSIAVYDAYIDDFIYPTFDTRRPCRINTGDYVDVIFDGHELYFRERY